MASAEGPVPSHQERSKTQKNSSSIGNSPHSSASPDEAVRQDETSEHGVGSPGTTSMGPPSQRNANGKRTAGGNGSNKGDIEEKGQSVTSGAAGAAAASQQPKIVQTAFIHKLYNMLEDTTIQHLICWSNSGESFLISPSSEFSKVLSTYFKHTNVSSFVRQLNMYGFHKVSDVFQTGSPDSPLWEFKHGGGNFKRGDLTGLREIKRRASRHTLIHRDSFSGPSKGPTATAPVVPNNEAPSESSEVRLNALEQALWDVHGRLSRSEDAYTQMTARCFNIHDHLLRTLQLNYDISSLLVSIASEKSPQHHSTASSIQAALATRLEQARRDHDSFYGYQNPRPQLSGPDDGLSPRQRPQQDVRLEQVPPLSSQPAFFRPLAPSNRAGGSFSGRIPSITAGGAIDTSRNVQHSPMQPVHQHPLASSSSAAALSSSSNSYMPRRHTSADIRSDGWLPDRASRISEAPLNTPTRRPSPGRIGQNVTEQLPPPPPLPRDYRRSSNFAPTIQQQPSEHGENSPSTPPHMRGGGDSRWYALGGKIPFKDVFKNTGVNSEARLGSPSSSAPPTRRSSVANIHMMLNPTDGSERNGDEKLDSHGAVEEARKRKRLEY